MIGSYLRAPVQGWAQSNNSSFAENISTERRGPHDSSGVAIKNDHKSRKTKGALSDTLRRDRDGSKATIQVLLKISAVQHSAARATRQQAVSSGAVISRQE
jgi:hypothetical protein